MTCPGETLPEDERVRGEGLHGSSGAALGSVPRPRFGVVFTSLVWN